MKVEVAQFIRPCGMQAGFLVCLQEDRLVGPRGAAGLHEAPANGTRWDLFLQDL